MTFHFPAGSEQVAEYVADIRSARQKGHIGGVTYDAELQKFSHIPFDAK